MLESWAGTVRLSLPLCSLSLARPRLRSSRRRRALTRTHRSVGPVLQPVGRRQVVRHLAGELFRWRLALESALRSPRAAEVGQLAFLPPEHLRAYGPEIVAQREPLPARLTPIGCERLEPHRAWAPQASVPGRPPVDAPERLLSVATAATAGLRPRQRETKCPAGPGASVADPEATGNHWGERWLSQASAMRAASPRIALPPRLLHQTDHLAPRACSWRGCGAALRGRPSRIPVLVAVLPNVAIFFHSARHAFMVRWASLSDTRATRPAGGSPTKSGLRASPEISALASPASGRSPRTWGRSTSKRVASRRDYAGWSRRDVLPMPAVLLTQRHRAQIAVADASPWGRGAAQPPKAGRPMRWRSQSSFRARRGSCPLAQETRSPSSSRPGLRLMRRNPGIAHGLGRGPPPAAADEYEVARSYPCPWRSRRARSPTTSPGLRGISRCRSSHRHCAGGPSRRRSPPDRTCLSWDPGAGSRDRTTPISCRGTPPGARCSRLAAFSAGVARSATGQRTAAGHGTARDIVTASVQRQPLRQAERVGGDGFQVAEVIDSSDCDLRLGRPNPLLPSCNSPVRSSRFSIMTPSQIAIWASLDWR